MGVHLVLMLQNLHRNKPVEMPATIFNIKRANGPKTKPNDICDVISPPKNNGPLGLFKNLP